jgi:hypothetical protein
MEKSCILSASFKHLVRMCNSLSYIESLMTSNKVHVKVINRCYIWTYFRTYLVMSDEVLPYKVLHYVTICFEGLVDVAAFYWLTSMVENNP